MLKEANLRKLPGLLFAAVLGFGYLAAITNLYLTNHLEDGEAAMTPRDIVVRFHGDPKMTRLAVMAKDKMHKHFKAEQEFQTLIAWNDAGAKEGDFQTAHEVLEARCEKCHSEFGKASFAPLTTYEEVSVFTKPNTGISFQRLALLSHQHLFGMGLLCLSLSLILWNQTRWDYRFKAGLTCLGFLGLLCDIGGWWLTKLSAAAAPLVIGGGAMMGTFFGLGILAVWADFFFLKDKASP